MDHTLPTNLGTQGKQIPEARHASAPKLPYQPPHLVAYGSVAQLTQGSGGDYDDECTSGKYPGDDDGDDK